MSNSPVTASEADLCRLAAIVTADREDLPAQGLPLSLLSAENIYGRLQVSSRTAAVLRAFPDLVAQDR
jgi:hypothetical protein